MVYSRYTFGSTNILAIQYNSDTRITAIRFKSGYLYYFYNTSKRVYDEIINSGSVGKAFWQKMALRYSYRMIRRI